MKKFLKRFGELTLIFLVVGIIGQFIFHNVIADIAVPKVSISLVNEDHGTVFNDTSYYFGEAFVKQLEKDKTYDWNISSRAVAETKLNNDEVDLVVIIPSNFSAKALAINAVNPNKINLTYLINKTGSFSDITRSNLALEELKGQFNTSLIEVYFSSILQQVDNIKKNLVEMNIEEQRHEELLVNSILVNTLAIEQEIAGTNDYAENFAEGMKLAEGSHDVHYKEALSNLDAIEEYIEEYNTFLQTYKENNQKWNGLHQGINNLFDYVSADVNKGKFTSLISEIDILKTYFSEDLIVNLTTTLEITEQALQVSQTNSNLIDLYIADNGPLDTYYNELTEKLVSQDNNVAGIDNILTSEMTNLCQQLVGNTMTTEAKAAATSCVKLGFAEEQINDNRATFNDESVFVVEAGDEVEMNLHLNDTNLTFNVDQSTICLSNTLNTDNVIVKQEVGTSCTPLSAITEQNILLGQNGEEIFSYSYKNMTDLRQYIVVKYQIQEKVSKSTGDVKLIQRLRVLNKINQPITVMSISDEGEKSNKRVMKLFGEAMPNTKVSLCAIAKAEEQVIDNCSNLSSFISSQQIPTTMSDNTGKWTLLVTFINLASLDSFLKSHQYYLSQSTKVASDGDKLSINNENNINTSTADIQSEWEAVTLTQQAHVKTVVPAQNGHIVSDNKIPINARVYLKIMTATDKLKEEVVVYPNTLGEWEYVTSQPVALKDIIIIDLIYPDPITNNDIVIQNKATVRDLKPLSVFGGANNKLNITKTISGWAERGSQITIMRRNDDGTYVDVMNNVISLSTWSYNLSNSSLQVGDIIKFKQTFLGIDYILEQEYELVDAVNFMTLQVYGNQLNNDANVIYGEGIPDTKVIIENKTDEVAYCTVVGTDGSWELTNEISDECESGVNQYAQFSQIEPNKDYQIYQTDQVGHTSDSIQFSAKDSTIYLTNSNVSFDTNTKILSGKTIIPDENQSIYAYYWDTANILHHTQINSDGMWEIDLVDQTLQKQPFEFFFYTSPSHDFEADVLVGLQTFSYMSINVDVSESSAQPEQLETQLRSNLGQQSFQSTLKMRTLTYEDTSFLPVQQLNSYFKVYFNKEIKDIYLATGTLDETYFCPKGSSNNAIFCLKTAHQNVNPQMIVDAWKNDLLERLEKLADNENKMQEDLQQIVESLDSEINMVEQKIEDITNMSLLVYEVASIYDEIEGQSVTIYDQTSDLAESKEEEEALELVTSSLHADLLMKSEELSETSDNLLKTTTSQKESSEHFAETTQMIKNHSIEYAQIVSTETEIIQQNVETNTLFVENVLGSFQNSQINGIENQKLYRFLAQPIIKDDIEILGLAALVMYPYLMTIIISVLSLLIGYYFSVKKEKIKLGYVDEYLSNTIKQQARYMLIMEITVLVIAIILGVLSGYYAAFNFWQYIKWVVVLAISLSCLTQCVYWLLEKLKVVGLFIIMSMFILYLSTNNVIGAAINTETLFGTVLQYLPLQAIEDSLNMIVAHGIMSTSVNQLLLVSCLVCVLFIILNSCQNTLKIYTLLKRNELDETTAAKI